MHFEPFVFPDIMPFKLGPWQVSTAVRPVGFNEPPGASHGSPNQVLNSHTYCCQLNHDVCNKDGEPVTGSDAECMAWHEKRLGTRQEDAKRLGIPMFVTEFGACMNSDNCARELR